MMSDLIDRRKLLEEITSEQNLRDDRLMSEWYADMVKRQPKVDAEEGVIRCKECRYAYDYDHDGTIYCCIPGKQMVRHDDDPNWFCADGRKGR